MRSSPPLLTALTALAATAIAHPARAADVNADPSNRLLSSRSNEVRGSTMKRAISIAVAIVASVCLFGACGSSGQPSGSVRR